MPKQSPHPHVAWRNGRPRFSPGPQLRAKGHQARDLKHPDGRWFSKGEAVDWSAQFAAELKKQPQAPRGRPAANTARPARLTVGKMVEAWQLTVRWRDGGTKPLKPRTQRDYRQKLKAFQDDFPEVWTSPAESITRPILQGCYDELEEKRGLATARGAIVVLGACYKWAIIRGKVTMTYNPATELDKQMPPPRVRFGTRPEILALITAADELGMPYVGDAIMLGLWSSQRQGDRLRLKHHGRLRNRRMFRQSKTGAIVAILEAPELEARIAANLKRREAAAIVDLATVKDPHVILNERTWRPYQEDTYRHDFAKVRAHAVKSCPSLEDFHDQDLRDTGVTWMALAGATIPEIAAVTGHSSETVHSILKHYLARHPEMADSAIRKMITWYDAGGETEIG
jgi:hypothetical protein